LKKFFGFALISVFTLAIVMFASDDPVRTYEGEVSDIQCAMNVHSLTRSHQEMLKSKSHGNTPAACAIYCVEYLGGRFVLVSGKNVYHLDNDGLVKKFAAEKVKISGVLDAKTESLHVISIDRTH
jgi:hypothetical protein